MKFSKAQHDGWFIEESQTLLILKAFISPHSINPPAGFATGTPRIHHHASFKPGEQTPDDVRILPLRFPPTAEESQKPSS